MASCPNMVIFGQKCSKCDFEMSPDTNVRHHVKNEETNLVLKTGQCYQHFFFCLILLFSHICPIFSHVNIATFLPSQKNRSGFMCLCVYM